MNATHSYEDAVEKYLDAIKEHAHCRASPADLFRFIEGRNGSFATRTVCSLRSPMTVRCRSAERAALK
jgi:hypothetical protein